MKTFYLTAFLLMVSAAFINAQENRQNSFLQSEFVKSPGNGTEFSPINRETTCDTLRFPLQGEITYYYLMPPQTGYVTGNNSFGDKVKAEYFSSFTTGSHITGIVAEFAVAVNRTNPDVRFGIWDNSGEGGKPGNLLAEASKPMASIVFDAQNEKVTTVMLQEPLAVEGPFYVGVILPVTTGDTVALWCRKHVVGYNGTAWDQWSDGTWFAFNDPENWGTNIQTTMTIHPIVCKTTGIEPDVVSEAFISPVSGMGIVNVNTWKSSEQVGFRVYSSGGALVYSRMFPGAVTSYNVDLSFLPKGIYVVRLSDKDHTYSQKIIIQ
jgi:hypothetical protein